LVAAASLAQHAVDDAAVARTGKDEDKDKGIKASAA